MKKVALITGGTRGIGFGIAEKLALEGFDLAVNGIRDIKLIEAQLDKLKSHGNEVLYCQGNIGESRDRLKILEQVIDRFIRIDVLVNNAGIAPRQRNDILESTEESYEEVMKINLQGPYFLTQSVANFMIDLKTRHEDFLPCIINISSISATMVSINRGEYCLSKAGVGMMTQLFAVRLGEFNIPVFEIRPGITKTDMTSGVTEKYDKLIDDGLCVQKRWGLPDDIGKVVAALVNGSLAYSTGQVIMVDGGLSIPRL